MATTNGGQGTAAPTRTSSPPPGRTPARARNTSTCGGFPPGCAWKCSTSCSASATSRTPGCRRRTSGLSRPCWPPRAYRPCWTGPRNGGPPALRGDNGHGWRAFVLDARRRVEALAFGAGWETEYPRDTWRLRVLGIARGDAAIRFTGIPQPWLKDLAKRYARWQLSTGLTAATARAGALGVTRFAAWLASLPEPPAGLGGVDRPLLERYLAVLHAEMGGQQRHQQYVSALSGFLREIRRHGWDGTLPATAVIFPEDFPARGARLPRGLAEHVMAQVEQPASLDRWDNPAYRLITVILIRCGLRISSACRDSRSTASSPTPTAPPTCATTTPR